MLNADIEAQLPDVSCFGPRLILPLTTNLFDLRIQLDRGCALAAALRRQINFRARFLGEYVHKNARHR